MVLKSNHYTKFYDSAGVKYPAKPELLFHRHMLYKETRFFGFEN